MGDLLVALVLILCGSGADTYGIDPAQIDPDLTMVCEEGWMDNPHVQQFLETGDYESLPLGLKNRFEKHVKEHADAYDKLANDLGYGSGGGAPIIVGDDLAD